MYFFYNFQIAVDNKHFVMTIKISNSEHRTMEFEFNFDRGISEARNSRWVTKYSIISIW